ncbi:unnamed protein product [marine sediment metagenome]|uniref:Uncharacterized protein n=1 Tax=marine sediment metagenome TaxID=412755 RepID=X1CLP3_9ZZZZ
MASSAVFSGTAVIAVAGTAVQLRSTGNTVKGGNIVTPLSNKSIIRVGPSGVTDDDEATTAGCWLPPDRMLPITGSTETDVWYINGKAGDRVYFEFHT